MDPERSEIFAMIDELNKNAGTISKELLRELDNISKDLKEKLNVDPKELSQTLESIGGDFKDKIDKIAENINKSTDSISTKVSEETSELKKSLGDVQTLDKNLKDLQQCLSNISITIPGLGEEISDLFGNLATQEKGLNTYKPKYKKSIPETIPMELSFENPDGNIYLEGYGGDKLEIEVYCKTPEKDIGNVISITDEPGAYRFAVKKLPHTTVSLDIRTPNRDINNVYAAADGRIRVCDLKCNNLICKSTKGRVSLAGLNCISIVCSSGEGRVSLADIWSPNLSVKTSNSSIIADNICCNICSMKTSNGKIIFQLSDEMPEDKEIDLSTDNDKIDVALSIPDETPLYIEALTTESSINVDIPDIICDVGEQPSPGIVHFICHTPSYDPKIGGIRLKISTVNAPINIK